MKTLLNLAAVGVLACFASPALAGKQDAVDGCIDGVRAQAGGGGQVLSADKMGNSWYVHLEDASGGEWDCYANDAGRVEQLTSVTPANARGGPETKEARRACRRALRQQVGRGGIEVNSAEFSQANTLVMLTDGDGGEWRCLASNRGEVAELRPVGGGAGGNASSEPETTTQRVRFPSGQNGTEITSKLTPGSSARYVLGARAGQDFYVRVDHRAGPRLDFQIFNPDGTFLLEMIPTDKEYRGELWQSGDHVVEVINRGGANGEYIVIFGLD